MINSYDFIKISTYFKSFSLKKKIQIEKSNRCSSCISWKYEYAKSNNQNMNIIFLVGKIGLCIGRGGDGFQTQFDDTCSMWQSVV